MMRYVSSVTVGRWLWRKLAMHAPTSFSLRRLRHVVHIMFMSCAFLTFEMEIRERANFGAHIPWIFVGYNKYIKCSILSYSIHLCPYTPKSFLLLRAQRTLPRKHNDLGFSATNLNHFMTLHRRISNGKPALRPPYGRFDSSQQQHYCIIL